MAASAGFWASRSIEEMVAEQNVQVVENLDELVMPEWPEDETADEVIAYIRAQRRAELTD